MPEEEESFKLVGEELIEKIREKERLRREEEEKREREIKENNSRGSRQMTPEMRERFMNMSEEERAQMRSTTQQQRGGGGQGS
jgi:hypothetical protein